MPKIDNWFVRAINRPVAGAVVLLMGWGWLGLVLWERKGAYSQPWTTWATVKAWVVYGIAGPCAVLLAAATRYYLSSGIGRPGLRRWGRWKRPRHAWLIALNASIIGVSSGLSGALHTPAQWWGFTQKVTLSLAAIMVCNVLWTLFRLGRIGWWNHRNARNRRIQ